MSSCQFWLLCGKTQWFQLFWPFLDFEALQLSPILCLRLQHGVANTFLSHLYSKLRESIDLRTSVGNVAYLLPAVQHPSIQGVTDVRYTVLLLTI